MTRPGRSSQAFAYLRSQTPSCHAAEVRPLDWRSTLTYLSPRAVLGVAERRRLRLRPAHKRGGPGSGASEPERLRVDATRPHIPWRRASGMETITTGHFQWLACRHSLSVHLTGLTCDGCAECLPPQDGVIVLLGG